METQKCENFQKVQNWRNWILSVPRVSVCREKISPWLRQYQSYISNWYVNGKVFTSSTTWESKNLIFFFQKSSKLNLTCILTCAEELKSFKWVSTCTYMSTSGMHRRPFEGRHLVWLFVFSYFYRICLYLFAYAFFVFAYALIMCICIICNVTTLLLTAMLSAISPFERLNNSFEDLK